MTLPYITVSGVKHDLEGDEDGFYFASEVIPACGECGEPIVDGEAPRPTVESHWHDDHYVTCDFCDAHYRITEYSAANPRQRGDDGVEYADPRDRRDGVL